MTMVIEGESLIVIILINVNLCYFLSPAVYQSYHCHLGDFQTHWVQACMRSPRLTWSICIWKRKENLNKRKEPKELVVDRGGGEGKSKYHWATPRDGRDDWDGWDGWDVRDGWDNWDSDGTIEQPLKMVEMLLGWNGMSIGCCRRWSWPADHWWRCAKGRWSHRSRCARHNCNHSIHTVFQNHWALWIVEAFKAKVLCMSSQQVSDTSSPPGKVSGQSKLSSSSSLSQPVLRKVLLRHAQGQGGNL